MDKEYFTTQIEDDLLTAALNGDEPVTILRGDEPVAVIMNWVEYQNLKKGLDGAWD